MMADDDKTVVMILRVSKGRFLPRGGGGTNQGEGEGGWDCAI